MKIYAFASRALLLTGLLLCGTVVAFAQPGKKGTSPDNCRLDEAKRWYEEGRLERIEEIEACAKDPKSMSTEKRIEAFELLTESYLYRDKIGAADRSFQDLLRIDPLYEPDSIGESYESYDLIYLSNTYTRRPIFSMYFGLGGNYTHIEQLENYGVDNTTGANDYETFQDRIVFGGNATVGFELPLIWGFDLTLDATFGYRAYSFADSLYISLATNPTGQTYSNEETPLASATPLLYSTLTFREDQFWIDVPLTLRYNIENFHGFLPYVYVGGAANFLIHAQLTDVDRANTPEITADQSSLQPSDIVLTNTTNFLTGNQVSMRTQVNWSLVAGAGVKFRLGRNFIYADFRYTRMFLNAVERDNRYANRNLLYNYAHVDNDFRMDNFALTVGFVKAFYVPRKKRKHNPLVINGRYNRFLERERNYIKRETDEDLRQELNSAIKEMERNKPSLIEDVQKGKREGMQMLKDQQRQIEDIKNKRVRVEVKYE